MKRRLSFAAFDIFFLGFPPDCSKLDSLCVFLRVSGIGYSNRGKLRKDWLRVFALRIGVDHLSNVALGVRAVNRLLLGDQYSQTTLARLRFGHSKLAALKAKHNDTISSMCE